MRLHNPELFEAHLDRQPEHLLHIAKLMNCASIAEAEERNWIMTEIKSGFEAPTEEAPAPKKRGRKPGTKNNPSQAAGLLAALEFVAPVETDLVPWGEYVSLAGNMAIMTNGQLSAGHPIAEELTLSPQLERLRKALSKCGKTLVITETEAQQLSIKGENIRALVPCMTEPLHYTAPDTPILEGELEVIKQAFKVCGKMASEAGERVVEASLLLDPYTCTGTNGAAMLQFWHGLILPPGTVIPKTFAAAVANSKKKLTGLGGTWDNELGFLTSFTCWFEGGAWIKTQTYQDRWPNIEPLLRTPADCDLIETPANLFEAIDAVLPFIDDERTKKPVYFVEGSVQSHPENNVGAQYAVTNLPGGKTFDGVLLKQIGPWCKTIDLTTAPDRAYFFGDDAGVMVRGAVMAMGK